MPRCWGKTTAGPRRRRHLLKNAPTLSDDEALRLFTEPNAFRWAEKWRAQDVAKRTIGWNWGALFLGPLWLMYRKLWAWGAGMFALEIVLTIFNVHAQVTKSIGVTVLCSLLGLGLAIFAALRADDIYRQHATRRAAAINREGHEPQRVSDKLRLDGGVSWPAAIGTLLAWLFAVFVIVAANPAPTENFAANEMVASDATANAADAMTSDANSMGAVAENVTTTDAMAANETATNATAPQLCSDGKNREITIANTTGKTIYRLKAWSPSNTTWSADLLGASTLQNESSIKVTVANGCACDYEFRAYTGSVDGPYLDYAAIDVCAKSRVQLGAGG